MVQDKDDKGRRLVQKDGTVEWYGKTVMKDGTGERWQRKEDGIGKGWYRRRITQEKNGTGRIMAKGKGRYRENEKETAEIINGRVDSCSKQKWLGETCLSARFFIKRHGTMKMTIKKACSTVAISSPF